MLSYIIGFFSPIGAILRHHDYFARSSALFIKHFLLISENTAHIALILPAISLAQLLHHSIHVISCLPAHIGQPLEEGTKSNF